VNGAWVRIAEATVPLVDGGLLLGLAVYEAYRLYRGRPFRLEAHWARLQAGASALGLTLGDEWPSADTVHARCGATDADGLGYVLVTPTTRAWWVRDLPAYRADLWTTGAAVALAPDLRWQRCDLKTTFLVPNALAGQEALAAGYDEAVFVRDGWLQEGTHSNVWVVRQGHIGTPAVGPGVLPGVTRGATLEACRAAGLPVYEGPVPAAMLTVADEVFLTSTSWEVLPVVRVGERPVGTGRPGPVTQQVQDAFLALRDRELDHALAGARD
jgi:D-alanine transaminase